MPLATHRVIGCFAPRVSQCCPATLALFPVAVNNSSRNLQHPRRSVAEPLLWKYHKFPSVNAERAKMPCNRRCERKSIKLIQGFHRPIPHADWWPSGQFGIGVRPFNHRTKTRVQNQIRHSAAQYNTSILRGSCWMQLQPMNTKQSVKWQKRALPWESRYVRKHDCVHPSYCTNGSVIAQATHRYLCFTGCCGMTVLRFFPVILEKQPFLYILSLYNSSYLLTSSNFGLTGWDMVNWDF